MRGMMLQAITTKYLGPTNHRCGRIVATCNAGTLPVSYDYDLEVADNHRRVATQLADSLGWLDDRGTLTYRLVGGVLPHGKGYAFVILVEDSDNG
jgi:hypothetical protein